MGADATVPRHLIGLLVAVAIGCSEGGDGSPGRPADAAPTSTSTAEPATSPVARLDDTLLPGAAWSLRETSTGRIVAQHQPQHLETRILPGSIAKVVTALAALEQEQAGLQVRCPRRLTLHGRVLDCVHPAHATPFTLAEALAYSCNTYFTRLGARLDRGAWQRLAIRLGVPAVDDATVPPELMAIGLEGPTASAIAWQRVVARALSHPSIPLAHRRVVADGLRAAAREGTASALFDDWRDTLAKTGTLTADGRSEGLAIVVRPDENLDLAVRVRGGAGHEAAAVAASVLALHAPGARTLRQGVWTASGLVVRTLPLEDYVGRVVAAEGTPGMPGPALEALAVAARTYAVAHKGRHASAGFDLCDSTHCQVTAERVWQAAGAAAVRTRAAVLADGGTIVPVFYSAACPGRLQAANALWGGPASSVEYVGVEPHPHQVPQWHAEVTERALTGALREAGFTGELLRALRVTADASARPGVVELDGLAPSRVSAQRFRTIVGRALGWDVLKSDTWTARRTAAGVRFEGRGKGHGVGLCVAGATAYAATAGASARVADVLGAYYPALRLRSLADTVHLRLTHASQGRGPLLLRRAYETLLDLRRELAFGAPRTIDIVEHPTIEAYQRATGRAWWTGGSTRMTTPTVARIDLPPLDVLERTGSGERRLRHELTHALTATSLHDAPLWAQEGLAVHLAGGASSRAEAMAADTAAGTAADTADTADTAGTAPGCPTDAQMARPGGAGAMREAYARAAACVARALAAGTPWRRVR